MERRWVAEMILEVRAELQRVESAIRTLEASARIVEAATPKRKRGRPSMGEEERKQVSERMTRYWDEWRRAGRQRVNS